MQLRSKFQWIRTTLTVALVAASFLATTCVAGPITDNQLKAKFEEHRHIDFITVVASTNPLAFYRLRQTTGKSETGETTYSASGGVTSARPGAPIGMGGNRFAKLDGHDGYITTTQVGGIGTAASMMAWVNLAQLPSEANHVFYVMGESHDGNDLGLQFENDNTLKFYTASGSPLTFTPSAAKLTNQWHLIVVTVNTRTKARVIYWDGESVANDKDAGEPNKTGILSIGASTVFSGRFFNGGIEEAALWDRALTEDEVSQIYAASEVR